MANAEQIVHDVAARVREIVTEAEQRAAQIVREAEADAQRIRERAENDSRERLAIVRRALDELENRIAGGRPARSSENVSASSAGAAAEVTPGPVTVPEPAPPSIPEPAPDPVPEPSPDPVPEPAPDPQPEPAPPPEEGPPPGLSRERSDDAAAARLVAMNMALDGASREEIEAHLAEGYALEDAGAIVDDVLALAAR